jgi:hypothetical protein
MAAAAAAAADLGEEERRCGHVHAERTKPRHKQLHEPPMLSSESQ